MKTREWILLIVVVVLSQALLHYLSTEVMTSSEVINYISFSGTIVSIILAVLAIIYSFYQSYSQQMSSSSISYEIKKLSEVSNGLAESTTKIALSVDEIPHAVERINTLPELVDGIIGKYSSDMLDNNKQMMVKIDRLMLDTSVGTQMNDMLDLRSNYLAIFGMMLASLCFINGVSTYEIACQLRRKLNDEDVKIIELALCHANGALSSLFFFGKLDSFSEHFGMIYKLGEDMSLYDAKKTVQMFIGFYEMWFSERETFWGGKDPSGKINSSLNDIFLQAKEKVEVLKGEYELK